MSKVKRHFISFEVSAEEEKMLDQRAKQEGVSRSQYIREAVYMELFLSGDLEAYKFLGREAGLIMREVLATKARELGLLKERLQTA